MKSLRLLQAMFAVWMFVSGALYGYAAVGSPAPDFQVKDFNQKDCSLAKYQGKVVVLEWTNPACPYVRKHYSRNAYEGVGDMQSMQIRFTDPSVEVVWIMIDSVPRDRDSYLSEERWKAQLQQWGAHPTTLIIDESGELAKLYDAQRTPEVFIIGKDGTLLYRGAVDSLRGTDPSEIEQFSNLHWLRNGIENALQGRRVIPPETIPYGCPIR